MPRGPLPDPDAVRRNRATIPTTELPASGRDGPAPKPPSWGELGEHGLAWWQWAWSTPEACGWSDSLIDVVGQRAMLVDTMWALDTAETPELDDMLKAAYSSEGDRLRMLIRRLTALAMDRPKVMQVAAQLDQQLGFGAKNLAQLRWKIVADPSTEEEETPDVADGSSRSRFTVVAGGAAG